MREDEVRVAAIGAAWRVTSIVFACIAALGGGLGTLLWPAARGSAWLLFGLAAVAIAIALVARGRGLRVERGR